MLMKMKKDHAYVEHATPNSLFPGQINKEVKFIYRARESNLTFNLKHSP